MQGRGAHLCSESEIAALGKLCNRRGHMNPDVVGQDPWRIAEMAGFSVPRTTTVLLAPQGGVGPEWPLSIEILAPILSVHVVDGWEEGCRVSMETLEYDGLGHTLRRVGHAIKRCSRPGSSRSPPTASSSTARCSQGAVGYSTHLVPSMSLGCGPQAGNITSDNISARHLVNVKRAAFPRRDWDDARAAATTQRAAALGGEAAPRGSRLPGDPALGAARAAARGAWRARRPSATGAATRPRARPASRCARAARRPSAGAARCGPAPEARRLRELRRARRPCCAAPRPLLPRTLAPVFVETEPVRAAFPAPAARSSAPPPGPPGSAGSARTGDALSAAEIQSIMSARRARVARSGRVSVARTTNVTTGRVRGLSSASTAEHRRTRGRKRRFRWRTA